MEDTQIKTLGVQRESSHDREPLSGHDYTRRDMLGVQWTATSFLDLPAGQFNCITNLCGLVKINADALTLCAEIRNDIYGLICAPISDPLPRFYWSKKSEYYVKISSQEPIYLSPISKLCRQIRKEYLSLLLPKHSIRLVGLEAARIWLSVFGDESTRMVRALSLKRGVSIPFRPGASESHIATQSHCVESSEQIGLHAFYNINSCGGVSLTFFLDCGSATTLRRTSIEAVRDLIIREPRSDDYFTFTYFLSLTEQISRLNLQVRFIDPPIKPGLVVDLRPLCFHVFPPMTSYLEGSFKESAVRIATTERIRYRKPRWYRYN